jgi:uncharacterized membrane protein
MNNLLRAFIFSNTWVSLCFSVLCFGIAHHNKLPHLIWIGVFSFCGTFASYHLHRLLRLPRLKTYSDLSSRIHWLVKHQKVMNVLFVIACILTIVSIFQFPLKLNTILLLGIVALVIGLYALPIPFLNLQYGLRTIPTTKIFWITACWTLVCCIPFLFNNTHIPFPLICIISLTVFAQVIPFDIRDYKNDDKRLHTIPQLIGVPMSRALACVLITIACAIYTFYNEFHPLILVYWVVAVIGFLLPLKNKNELILELFWEFPLLILGSLYYFGQFR